MGFFRIPCSIPLLFAITAYTAPSTTSTPDPAGIPLVEFFQTAYARNFNGIAAALSPRYRALCKSLGISDTSTANRDALLPLLFQHRLLTSTDAVDCRRGGVLGTVYFWHWIAPNPRHALRRLPDSALLSKLPPPPGFAKYRSWADVDRPPSLYLGDLVTEHARYAHPVCGEIQTFGWCSEREMAFGTLLRAQGIKGKIKQDGIHVWSEALFDLVGTDGKQRTGVVAFDNTFDSVEGWPLRGSRAAWAGDFGDGSQVGWYNRVAASESEIAKVKGIRVGSEAQGRMLSLIKVWLGKGR